METLSGLFARIFLRAAIVSIILGVIARLFYYQSGSAHLPWFFGITASAFLRFTDTCLLFAIAFAVMQLIASKQTEPEKPSEPE